MACLFRPARLVALALARALLAGPREARGMAARMRACMAAEGAWIAVLAGRCAAIPPGHWQALDARRLARWIEHDPTYREAWAVEDPAQRPVVRAHILRPQERMGTPPLGLHRVAPPAWPNTAALARGLGLGAGGLWRLTRPCDWQRRSALGEQHYRSRLLAKRSGGWRLLEVPHPYLAGVQRRLLRDLIDRIPPHEAACGYVRGRSVLDHARAHAGQAVVLGFDLQDFFSSVHAGRVHALFATLGYPDSVARELTALCTVATPEPVLQRLREDGGLSWAQARRLRDAHLPQGAPTSPALANLCAFRLDLRLDALAHRLGARYTRYADDLVLSGDASLAREARRIEAWVGAIAREEGFALNHRKTRCQTAGQRQSVCHVVVNQRPNLPRDAFDRLRAILHRCATQGPASQNRLGHPDWRQHLEGRVAWAEQLNPQKARRLRRWLERIDGSGQTEGDPTPGAQPGDAGGP